MNKYIVLLMLQLFFITAFPQNEKKAVLDVVHQFFTTLESQDSATFRSLHLKDAKFYIVGERNDSVRTFARDVSAFTFDKKEIIKERMRDSAVVVQVHDRIATVWAPYDLWVNDKFSHCGVDVFTLLKTANGWKIASCSYSVETKACSDVR